jgi:hypothetical protein
MKKGYNSDSEVGSEVGRKDCVRIVLHRAHRMGKGKKRVVH